MFNSLAGYLKTMTHGCCGSSCCSSFTLTTHEELWKPYRFAASWISAETRVMMLRPITYLYTLSNHHFPRSVPAANPTTLISSLLSLYYRSLSLLFLPSVSVDTQDCHILYVYTPMCCIVFLFETVLCSREEEVLCRACSAEISRSKVEHCWQWMKNSCDRK